MLLHLNQSIKNVNRAQAVTAEGQKQYPESTNAATNKSLLHIYSNKFLRSKWLSLQEKVLCKSKIYTRGLSSEDLTENSL